MYSNLVKILCYEARFLMRAVAGWLALVILLACASPVAIASPGSLTVLNSCDLGYKALLQQRPLVKYAKTGELSAHWKPEHSRAFYMALLGMRDLLGSYLKTHRQALQYSDLLTAATYTDQRAIVAMLLEMGENPNRNGSDASTLPLQMAANCERTAIMVSLLSAGADVYGVPRKPNYNAMAVAVAPAHLDGQSYVEGVRLLLAAGFDPRCPVTVKGETAVDVVRNWKGGKTWLETKNLIDEAAKIASSRSPGKPNCGESGRLFRKADK